MNFPSSNTDGANPSAGDVISNVESSHGVRLSGGSTGGIVEPVGDDANIALTVRGKGTGAVRVGNSSSPALLGASTTPLTNLQRFVVQFTEPDLAASTWVNSTYTVAGLTTNCCILGHTPRLNLAAGYTIGDARCSTADELTIRWVNEGGSTISGSTNRLTFVAALF